MSAAQQLLVAVGGPVGPPNEWGVHDPSLTLSNANRTITKTSGTSNSRAARGTLARNSGVTSYEVTLGTVNAPIIGICNASFVVITGGSNGPGIDSNSWGYYGPSGQLYTSNVLSGYGASYGSGNIIRCEVDHAANTVTWYRNGVSQGPVSIPADDYYPCMSVADAGNTATADFSLW